MAVDKNRAKELNEEQRLLIEKYKAYLIQKGLSKRSVSTYAGCINRFFNTKCAGTCYTVGGLRHRISLLIEWYSKGGRLYDANDRNKTVSALKHLKMFFDENPQPSLINNIEAYEDALFRYE